MFFHRDIYDPKEQIGPLNCEIILGDLGFAELLNKVNNYFEEAVGGSRYYKAPEQRDPVVKVTMSSDIWSVGVIAFIMKFKRYPFLNAAVAKFGQKLSKE